MTGGTRRRRHLPPQRSDAKVFGTAPTFLTPNYLDLDYCVFLAVVKGLYIKRVWGDFKGEFDEFVETKNSTIRRRPRLLTVAAAAAEVLVEDEP